MIRPRIWRPLRLPMSGRTIIHIDPPETQVLRAAIAARPGHAALIPLLRDEREAKDRYRGWCGAGWTDPVV